MEQVFCDVKMTAELLCRLSKQKCHGGCKSRKLAPKRLASIKQGQQLVLADAIDLFTTSGRVLYCYS
jgi:hypothetical protein